MSDFGLMITIHRATRKNTNLSDQRLVEQVARELAASGENRISDYADFKFRRARYCVP